ncbi:MAG: cell division protein FtsA [Bacilli bacterium]
MKHIYTSIDIGSDTIKVVVCELFNNKLNLLATSSVNSNGIKRGMITDVSEASLSLKRAISAVNEMLGIDIKRVITTIPSYYANFKMVKGEITITNNNHVVTGTDVSAVLQNAVKNNLSYGCETITMLPIDFKLDNRDLIKDPKGLTGDVLKVRGIMVDTPSKNVLSVVSLIESLDIEVVDISLNCIGDINAFRTKQMSSQIGAIVNIGYETTTISIYNKGIVVKNTVIGLGGRNIDNDISYIYKINLGEARKAKEKFALADKRFANTYEVFETVDATGEMIKIKQPEISEIVMSRVEEILALVRKEIKTLTNQQIDYIIVTGGTSNMRNFDSVVDKIFNKKALVGGLKIIGLRNNKYSSAVGNIVYFINKLKLKGVNYTMLDEDDEEELSSLKKSFEASNDSMLGKVFGYFFGE